MQVCPCGSALHFDHCCGLYLQHRQYASTAQALMRSRYSAYVRGDADYLLATQIGGNKKEIVASMQQIEWTGLNVLNTERGDENDVDGFVEFIAHYKVGNAPYQLHERSYFQKINGRWIYVDGVMK